jgi:putative transposase
MMKRTVSIRLAPTREQAGAFKRLQAEYAAACNAIVPLAREHRCWNAIKLHHHAYYKVREATQLGSQMVCQAIKAVATAYKVLKPKKDKPVPEIVFDATSVHFDKRTYSFKDDTLSLYTLEGRAVVSMRMGDFQRHYFETGAAKEAKLVSRKGEWFFNLVLDFDDAQAVESGPIVSVDLGENNIATLSTAKVIDGRELSHKRDVFLALRRRLQSNGSESAKQLLRKVSGRESRHVSHVNHEVSKQIVAEAVSVGASRLVMENLTNIRDRIKAGKRMRSRLHRWAWAQLQEYVAYKAEAAGINVVFVNPAYSSKTCSMCGCLGSRQRHTFKCSNCGSLQHSDKNACRNLCKLGETAVLSTRSVTAPNVELAA